MDVRQPFGGGSRGPDAVWITLLTRANGWILRLNPRLALNLADRSTAVEGLSVLDRQFLVRFAAGPGAAGLCLPHPAAVGEVLSEPGMEFAVVAGVAFHLELTC